MSVNLLVKKIKEKGNPSVAGLDPKIEYVPQYIREKAYKEYGKNLKGACEAIWEFNRNASLTPEPDTLVYMIKKGLKIKEVQFEMKER